MVLRQLICVLFMLAMASLKAQNFNGYVSSDYAGILGSRLNPASIANSPYKYDFNLLNGNFYFSNNIGYLTRNSTGDRGIRRFNDNQERFITGDLRLGGLSVMLALKNRSSIGFQYQMRGVASGIDITPEFIEQIGRFQSTNFVGGAVSDQKGDAAMSYWHELGLTYAFLLSENAYARWKLGATFKMVNPIGNLVARLENMDYELSPLGEASINTLQGQIGYSSNLDPYEPFAGNEALAFPDALGFTPALDIGFTYESVLYRDDPRAQDLTSYYPDILYEYKWSVSVTDIGYMTFDYGSASFDVIDILPSNDPINFDSLIVGANSILAIRDSLATITDLQALTGKYTVSMPTSLHINFDYNWKRNWYINIAGQFDLSQFMNTDYRLNYPNSITLTPRYETGEYGLYFPLYINLEGDLELGTAIRYGPFTIGTHSLGSLLTSEKKSLGVFFSINLRQLKANARKPYCFGKSKTGSALINRERKPLYKRKSLF